jgi:hypothetical protein
MTMKPHYLSTQTSLTKFRSMAAAIRAAKALRSPTMWGSGLYAAIMQECDCGCGQPASIPIRTFRTVYR